MTPVEGFTVCVEVLESSVTLLVRGELDISTGPELEAILAAVVGKGHRRVVLDLAECDFIDASGLQVIADTAQKLDLLGGELTIRSPSGIVQRLFDLVGPVPLLLAAPAGASPGPFGPAESGRPEGIPLRAALSTSMSHLGNLVTIPSRDEVVDSALRLVVALACASVEGADGVSVSLRRRGRLSTVAATDQTIREMDAGQYATGEGPCVDASIQGRRFHTGSLNTEIRWPAFTPKAQALGINAILSWPLVANDRPVGALNIYSRTIGAFTNKSQQLASVFAAEASTVLGDPGLDIADDQLATRLAAALETRQVIALAQGVTMERNQLDENDAYTALRRFSASNGRPLRERAEDIVASTQWAELERSAGAEQDDG